MWYIIDDDDVEFVNSSGLGVGVAVGVEVVVSFLTIFDCIIIFELVVPFRVETGIHTPYSLTIAETVEWSRLYVGITSSDLVTLDAVPLVYAGNGVMVEFLETSGFGVETLM